MDLTRSDLKTMGDDVALAYRRKGWKVWTQDFMYPTRRVVMPGDARQTRPEPILFQPDSIFCWLATEVTIANAANAIGYRPTVGFRIFDTSSSYKFSQQEFGELPAQLHSGQGGSQFLLSFPYLFRPGGRAQVVFRTLNTAALGTILLTLWGLKIYTRPFTRDLLYPEH
jgi:hypothetical protein